MNNLRSKFKLPFFITIFSLIVFSISCSLEETTDDTSEVEEEIVLNDFQNHIKWRENHRKINGAAEYLFYFGEEI